MIIPSTEKSVRDELIYAISEIGTTKLGFRDKEDSVKSYLLDFEHPELKANYLSVVLSDGSKKIRRWGVSVQANEKLAASNRRNIREYRASIFGYYGHYSGEDANLLTDHARLIRGAIAAKNTNLSGRVDLTSAIESLTIEPVAGDLGKFLLGKMFYTFVTYNPEF